MFCKKSALWNFAKLIGKHLCQILFFNKVAGLRPATLLKKRLSHRCFLVNFAKFLILPFLQNTFGQLLLYIPALWIIDVYEICYNFVLSLIFTLPNCSKHKQRKGYDWFILTSFSGEREKLFIKNVFPQYLVSKIWSDNFVSLQFIHNLISLTFLDTVIYTWLALTITFKKLFRHLNLLLKRKVPRTKNFTSYGKNLSGKGISYVAAKSKQFTTEQNHHSGGI